MTHRVRVETSGFPEHSMNFDTREQAETAAHTLLRHYHHVTHEGEGDRDSRTMLRQELAKVSKGEVGTYGDISAQIHSPK